MSLASRRFDPIFPMIDVGSLQVTFETDTDYHGR